MSATYLLFNLRVEVTLQNGVGPYMPDKAKALHGLELLDAARDTLTGALRRKKDLSADLLRAVRYERIQVYEDLGQHRRARSDLEKLYAEAPDYEDVATRLGV